MAAAQTQFIHGLIEQSRERVVQVRAGQSLVEVLESNNHSSPPRAKQQQLPKQLPKKKQASRATNTVLPSVTSPTMTLVYEARRHGSAVDTAESNNSAMRKHLRKQGVLAVPDQSALASTSNNATTMSSGRTELEEVPFVKFLEYMGGKSVKTESLRQNSRRKAITKSTPKMQQLTALSQSIALPPPANAAMVTESAVAKFARVVAVMKGEKAFMHRKKAVVSDAQQLANTKNPHFAFLDFKKGEADHKRQPRVALELDESNTKKRTPIHFGDQICFISDASNLPLSIGTNGRACRVANLSAGPHMMFTIMDFKNPSRHNQVTAADEFWLRVDSSLFRHDRGSGDDDECDVSSLLSETQYFLGCAGSIDDGDDDLGHNSKGSQNRNENLYGSALNYAIPPSPQKQRSKDKPPHAEPHLYDTFRLLAMKATVPSSEYYGDDKATREYTIETNENIVRLARWKFTHNTHTTLPKAGAAADLDTHDEEGGLLLNCTSVYLSLNHFALESDRDWNRGVMRDYSKRFSDLEEITDVLKRRGRSFAMAASWQIRLLHRTARSESPTKALSTSTTSPLKPVNELMVSPVEWLRSKQEQMQRNETKIRAKRSLVRTAKQSYENVATQSNTKLAEIEQRKAQHHIAYFQNRYHAIFDEPDEQESHTDDGEEEASPPSKNPHHRRRHRRPINQHDDQLRLPQIRHINQSVASSGQ